MKTYIGIQFIQAKKMIERDYLNSLHPGSDLQSGNDDPGYLIQYCEYEFQWISESEFMKIYKETTGMSFGLAIEALKKGQRVARAGWDKGMWLSLSCDGSRDVAAENFWSPHNAQFARENGGKATVLPSITMKTATGEILMGWLASQTDMLADDWVIV